MSNRTFSKSDGKYIGIRFDQKLKGDVTGYTPNPIGGYTASDISQAIESCTASSGSNASNAINGNIGNYWAPTDNSNSYLIFSFLNPVSISGFEFYQNSSYRVQKITVYGSDDGETFQEIGISENDVTTAGYVLYTFSNGECFSYYKVVFNQVYNNTPYIYNTIAYLSKKVGNEQAFLVKGYIYDYVELGQLMEKQFKVVNVSGNDDQIILEIDDYDRFESCIGDLQIFYDHLKGNLKGLGGAVKSFSISFTPTDLIFKGDQNDHEHVEARLRAIGINKRIYYSNSKLDEHVQTNISANGLLTNIHDI